jgi:hypothetical protein
MVEKIKLREVLPDPMGLAIYGICGEPVHIDLGGLDQLSHTLGYDS